MVIIPTQDITLQRFLVMGLSKGESLSVIKVIRTWLRSNGTEWTVSRLKAMKTDYVRLIAGQERDPQTWVAYRGNAPKGPFRAVFNLKGKKATFRALNALMVYSQFLSKEVTDKQWKKFHNSVSRQPASTEGVTDLIDTKALAPYRASINRLIRSSEFVKLEEFISSDKRAPVIPVTIREEKGRTYLSRLTSEVECESSILSNLTPLMIHPGRQLYAKFPDVFKEVIPEECFDEFRSIYSMACFNMRNHDGTQPANIPYVGRIGFIQEAGFKLRAVANPFRIYQAALSRLGNALFDTLKLLPWDCTHDQEKGVRYVQQKLKEGKTIHSIDLSDATNNFPRSLQVQLLSNLCYTEVELFEAVSAASWRCEQSPSKELHWTVGQPLGLYPSFAAFALTHGVVVRNIEQKLLKEDTFRILGDDIVISDDEVAKAYRAFLDEVGCPVSEPKCLTSSTCAEFAGAVILTDDVLRGFKWRSLSDDNFLDLIRQIGPKARRILRPRQRKVYDQVSEIPEFLGGFGLNPDGKSFLERISGFEYLLDSTSVPFVSETKVRLAHKDDSALARELNAYALKAATPTRSSPIGIKVLDSLRYLGFPVASTMSRALREKEKTDSEGAQRMSRLLIKELGSGRRAGYRISTLQLWETRLRQLQA